MTDDDPRTYTATDLTNLVHQTVTRLRARGESPARGREGLLPGSTAASRPTITVAEVERAGRGRLQVPADAVVTPAARDRARELGVHITSAPPAAGELPLNDAEEALVRELAEQLARDLSGQTDDEAACRCRTECLTKCADRVAMIARAGADRIGINGHPPPLEDAIAPLIDHTNLAPGATEAEIVRLCQEAVDYGFASVCINPYYVPLAADLTRGSRVAVCTVVGFPLGANMPETKAFEATRSLADGATELDMVINVGALRSARFAWVRHDIEQVVDAARDAGATVKVILETALLADEEKIVACEICRDAGAGFVKTSTGFGPGGATTDDVALMRRTVGRSMGVKASGGIGDRARAAEMIAAGATRIGASAGIRIATGD